MDWEQVPHADMIRSYWRICLPDRIPQALLWVGPEGVGKSLAAWMLTKTLLCLKGPHIDPCGECQDCRLIEKLEHPHLWILPPLREKVMLEEAVPLFRQQLQANPYLSLAEWELLLPETKGSLIIGVEAVRRLQEGLSLAVGKKQWRVVWFWHAETLTRQAANALLKLIEEPPQHTLFLFLASRTEPLPLTLRSRCQIWRFPPLSREELEALEGQPLSSALLALAQGSYGRLRRLRTSTFEPYIRALQMWLRSLLQEEGDPAPAIEKLLQAPQLSEILTLGAILIREHPKLSPTQKLIGMDTLLRMADEIEAHLQPALLLWEATLLLRAKWADPKLEGGWIAA
ncbi:MAG: hypothetical protein RMK19_07065 [Bacteroidia bacterium]|nr:hypothetical protein [Bacteroidia bacterium]MDW8015756.1 hypothetical protein [Bacteroidia bacterium]